MVFTEYPDVPTHTSLNQLLALLAQTPIFHLLLAPKRPGLADPFISSFTSLLHVGCLECREKARLLPSGTCFLDIHRIRQLPAELSALVLDGF